MFFRHYNAKPSELSLEDCYVHGANHKGYDWNRQPGLGWSDKQLAAYNSGYDGLSLEETMELLKD